ncbi:hypothetical protein [Clostridium sp.]|nr:hypothetical protein [Clostridium sp.]
MDILKFVMVLLESLFVVGAVAIYYVVLFSIIRLFLNVLDWIFNR